MEHLLHRRILQAACLLSLTLLFINCRKDKNEKEELPVFGSCEPVASKGRLTQNGPGAYAFKTSDGFNIAFDFNNHFDITHDSYPDFSLQLWGLSGITKRLCANHENLNGKHIKDRLGLRRTITFPDGTKLSMITDGAYANPLVSISIYTKEEGHYFNMTCNTLEYSSTNAGIARKLDDAEADGETATLELNGDGAQVINIYTEDTPGNKVMNRVTLAEVLWVNPNNIRDYYDDPRMAHT